MRNFAAVSYQEARPARVASSIGRGWKGIEVIRFTGYRDVSICSMPKHHAILHLNREPIALTQCLDGKRSTQSVRSGMVSIMPAGLDWEWSLGDGSDLLPLCLEDDLLRSVAQSIDIDPDGMEISPLSGGQDERIECIGRLLKAEIESTKNLSGGRLYAESLANALAITLIRDHSSLGRSVTVKTERGGRLSERALAQATDYVGDNLEKDLRLADIAGAAHMSPYHFSRLFRQATGFTPHRYVMWRRLVRAKELLTKTDIPIGEVAMLCGFANQSHLTRRFKSTFGATPKAARKR